MKINPSEMYAYMLMLNTLIFLGITSYSDLKTSLIDVRHIIAMVSIATLLHLIFAFILKTYIYVVYAILGGVIFLGIGYMLYLTSKWGEGDALILAGTVYSYPYPFYVPLGLTLFSAPFYYWYVLFFNTAIIGMIYSLLYALYFSLHKKSFYKALLKEIYSLRYLAFFVVLVVLGIITYFITYDIRKGIIISIAGSVMLITMIFAKLSDEILFTKKVKLKDVKEGDTVIGNFTKANFRGKRLDAITQQQLNNLVKHYGENKIVEVKDMVRYIPSFLLGFLFTLFYGDIIFRVIVG